jgi:hypothetical protein
LYIVSLHLQKYNPIIIVPTFFAFLTLFPSCQPRISHFFRNFAVQPDEETGSAEEQPASNMAVPTLESVFQEPPRPWAAYCFQMGYSAKKT